MAIESQKYQVMEDGSISLKELIRQVKEWWRYLLSKWIYIVVFGLIGSMLGFFYSTLKKPIYTATTTFVLEDESGNDGLGGLAGIASSVAGVDLTSGGGGIFHGDNILSLYKSRTMIEKTLLTLVDLNGKKDLLINRYIEFNKLRESWDNKPNLKNIQFTPEMFNKRQASSGEDRLLDSILGSISGDISKTYLTVARPDKKLSTIQVDVKAADEFFAKVFNDELVKNVNEFYISTKTKKNIKNVRILQHKTDSVRAVMNGAIYSAVAVSDATPNLNPTRQIQRAAPAQKSQFSAETNKAVLGEMVKNLELTKMTLLRETPLIQVIDQPIFPLYKERFGKLKGFVLGGIVFGVLTSLILIIRKFLNSLV